VHLLNFILRFGDNERKLLKSVHLNTSGLVNTVIGTLLTCGRFILKIFIYGVKIMCVYESF
jgi:hypothetical protein